MTSTPVELTDLRRVLGQLQDNLPALRAKYGDTPAMRRIVNDVERLDIDVGELAGPAPEPRRPHHSGAQQWEVVQVPDTPYDPELWRGADDEGVGGQGGSNPSSR